MATDLRFALADAVLAVGYPNESMVTLGRAHGLTLIGTRFLRAARTRLDADGISRSVGQGPRGGILAFTVDSTDGDDGTDRLFARLNAASAEGAPGDTLAFELRLRGTGTGLPMVASAGPAVAAKTIPQGIVTWLVTVNVSAPVDRSPQT